MWISPLGTVNNLICLCTFPFQTVVLIMGCVVLPQKICSSPKAPVLVNETLFSTISYICNQVKAMTWGFTGPRCHVASGLIRRETTDTDIYQTNILWLRIQRLRPCFGCQWRPRMLAGIQTKRKVWIGASSRTLKATWAWWVLDFKDLAPEPWESNLFLF